MKKLIKRVAIPCGIYWLILLWQLIILHNLTESWMILGVFLIFTARSMLWVSPFVLTAIVWIAGLWKPRCSAKYIVFTNVAVLVTNCLCFLGCYLLTGNWY